MECKIQTRNTKLIMAKQQQLDKRWYSKQEAAMYLGLSERYLDKLRETGKISFRQQREGNRPLVYFEKDKLDQYMCRNFKEIVSIEDFSKTLNRKSKWNLE